MVPVFASLSPSCVVEPVAVAVAVVVVVDVEVGASDGLPVGAGDGEVVGCLVGAAEGAGDGEFVGDRVGAAVGAWDGELVGDLGCSTANPFVCVCGGGWGAGMETVKTREAVGTD